MSEDKTSLTKIMLERADADGLAAGHELRLAAFKFDEAASGFYSDPQTVDVRTFFSSWAKARRLWHEYSGEPLL